MHVMPSLFTQPYLPQPSTTLSLSLVCSFVVSILACACKPAHKPHTQTAKKQTTNNPIALDHMHATHRTKKQTKPHAPAAQNLRAAGDRAVDERTANESDMHDLLLEQETLTEQYTQSQAQAALLRQSLQDVRIAQETGLRALIQTCIRASENLTQRASAENEVAATTGTSSYFRMVAEELLGTLNELVLVNGAYTNDAANNGESLARKVILAGHLLATVHVQGMTVCNTCKDIEAGESELWLQFLGRRAN